MQLSEHKIIFYYKRKIDFSNILASSVYDKYIKVVDVYSSLFFEKNTQILPFKTPTLLCVTCPPQLCFGVIIEDFTLTLSPTLMSTETFFVNKYENQDYTESIFTYKVQTDKINAWGNYLNQHWSQSPFLKPYQSSFFAQGNLQSKSHPEFLQEQKIIK